jgi:hypothetical protein
MESADPVVDVITQKVYESFVMELDAIDNGIEVCDKPAYRWCGGDYPEGSWFQVDCNTAPLQATH